jgi:hypothetical protein
MILPDFVLSSRINQIWTESGLDSKTQCLNKNYFKNYPYDVKYVYNSRGFRDNEWPTSGLNQSIWCVGDSFTVGIGAPANHTWPYILKSVTKTNTINVSLDGASNDWIARKTCRIIDVIAPKHIVIHWSYFHRYEIDNCNLTDEQRRGGLTNDLSIEGQFANLKKNLLLVETEKKETNIIHSFIPDASPILWPYMFTNKWKIIKGPDWPKSIPMTLDEFNQLPLFVRLEVKNFNSMIMEKKFLNYFKYSDMFNDIIKNVKYIPQIERLDFARDCHHYDIKTATKLVDDICQFLY